MIKRIFIQWLSINLYAGPTLSIAPEDSVF